MMITHFLQPLLCKAHAEGNKMEKSRVLMFYLWLKHFPHHTALYVFVLVDFYRSLEKGEGLTLVLVGFQGLRTLLYHRCSLFPAGVCVLKHVSVRSHMTESELSFPFFFFFLLCLYTSPCVCMSRCPCTRCVQAGGGSQRRTGAHSGSTNTEQSRARDDIYDLSHSATCFPEKKSI